jgi:hypothetical protein
MDAIVTALVGLALLWGLYLTNQTLQEILLELKKLQK